MDEPLDLSLPKKNDDHYTTRKMTNGGLFNDIKALDLPKKYRLPQTNLEDPAVLEKRFQHGQHTIASTSYSFYTKSNDFHTNIETNEMQDEAERVSFEGRSAFSLDSSNTSEDEITEGGEMSADEVNEDNCSTNSDISLFAPSLSGMSNSDTEGSIYVARNRTNGLDLTKNDAVVLENGEEKTMDERIEEIFAMTIRNSPKMISPIHDPPHLEMLSPSNTTTNGQPNEFQIESSSIFDPVNTEINDVLDPDNANRLKCEFDQTDQLYASNESLESIDEMPTEMDTMEPLNETMFKFDIDFKNVEKNTINAGNLNSGRTVTHSESSAGNTVDPTTTMDSTQPLNGATFKSSIDFKSLEKITINAGSLNSRRTVTHSESSAGNTVDPTTTMDSTQPLNGATFKSSIDFKSLEKITINAGSLNSRRTVTHSESSLEFNPYKELDNEVPVHFTRPQSQSSMLIQSAPILQPTYSVQNMETRSQSAQKVELKPSYEIQSVPVQSAPLVAPSVLQPTNSVQNLLIRPRSTLLEVPQHLQGMQYIPMQSTPPQQFAMPQPPQPMKSVYKVDSHSQPVMPMASYSLDSVIQSAVLTSPEHFYRIQSVPIQYTPPRFQPSPEQPSLDSIKSSPISPELSERFAENYITSSSKQSTSTDSFLSDEKKSRYITATLKLFEHPCINFLKNQPCAMPMSCPYNHQLPASEKILTKMHTFPNEKIHFIYQTFIVESVPTFVQYFPWICCLFGMRNMESTILSSVRDCDKYERYDFYKYIFGALLMCGKTDKEALGRMAEFVDVHELSLAAMIEIMNNPTNPYII